MSTAINYDKPLKNLIAELDKTGHVTHKQYKKTSVTIHHNAGRLSHEGVLNVWKVRPASAHFNIDGQGTACQYVRVNEYAWAVGDTTGNMRTISIEMANASLSPDWKVADKTWQGAADLAGWLFFKVIGERPTKENLFYHHYWSSTSCAGPYMDSIYGKVLKRAQSRYDNLKGGKQTAEDDKKDADGGKKSLTRIAAEVWAGDWGTGQERFDRLRNAGYDPETVQAAVNRGVGKTAGAQLTRARSRKSIADVVDEVIAGKWGTGAERRRRLFAAGYNATTVQNEVNRELGYSKRKSVRTLAREVIEGKWGDGKEREQRITRAGYSYRRVQNEVNRLLS